MKVRTLFLASLLFFVSCESEEFYPNPNDERDENLIGTWLPIDEASNGSLTVFTSEGYYGSTYLIDAPWHRGFSDLSMLWFNLSMPTELELAEIYIADNSEHWQKKRFEGSIFYKLSENCDTLYISNSLEDSDYDVYIKNEYNLLFDGTIWIGTDSIN